ncbi:MAG: hypothetical protein FWD45_07345 [Coriobacteriia bacterium]|nr:hypothetical protein [Coriobacteriia bacterium]
MSDYRTDRERWAQLSIYEQMGNIGSEVGRTIKAFRVNDQKRYERALVRALDLFAATTEQLVAEKSHRTKEVLRARNEFLRLFFDDTFESEADSIERYFMQFAYVARKQHEDKLQSQ